MPGFMRGWVVAIAAALAVAPLAARAQGHDRGREERSARYVVPPNEARIVREYYGRPNLPPGLAKREDLPPGLQRQLRRNGTLPPGLAKRYAPLPPELEGRLERFPQGRRRVIVGDRMLVIDDRTNRILDVIQLPRRR